ncbi:MAG: NYN domain-containing protein [Proteobacteria bacterium]|nr:NYN domain-containing protein [Pseudomonadota bacterium]
MKKIAIFVDVQNIYYTTRDSYGRQFDYRKFWKRLSSQGEIVIANAYAIQRDDASLNSKSQKKFQDALKHIGFTVKLKPYIQRSDGSAKGDWDVGITIDVMQTAKDVDTVILLSGDGDFDMLLDKVNSDYGVTTEVYGVPALTANSLIDAASIYHRIEEDLLQ